MSEFDDIFNAASMDLLATFGDLITYTQADGTAHTFLADFNQARDINGGDYQTSYLAATFTFRPGLVEPKPGDTIAHGGTLYKVERPLSGDGYFTEVVVV
ncbi:MAG: hypothetical protein RBS36_12435 [Thiomicrospira sp.]|jgi:plastocyanin|nr:hypothetical protein [Thiomicrospira sp.]